MTKAQIRTANRQLKGLIISLAIEFILGVILTTLVNYDSSKHSAAQTGFLVAHVVVAVGIIVGAIIQTVMSIKWHALRAASSIGLLSSVGAFASGEAAAKNGSDIAVFVMAMCFITAFICYGYSLLALKRA